MRMNADSHLFKNNSHIQDYKEWAIFKENFQTQCVADCSYTLLKLETINEKTNLLGE